MYTLNLLKDCIPLGFLLGTIPLIILVIIVSGLLG